MSFARLKRWRLHGGLVSFRSPLRSLLILLSLGFSVALLGPSASASEKVIDLRTIRVKPNPSLGLSFPPGDTKYFRHIAEAGIGVTRVLARWNYIWPRRDKWSWRSMDRRIKGLQAVGLEPFITFASDSEWGTEQKVKNQQNGLPHDMADWATFVAAVVERYDGDGIKDAPGLQGPVKYFQVANEWVQKANKHAGWGHSAEDLIEYVNVAHDAAKKASPETIFVMGGIAWGNLDVALIILERKQYEMKETNRSGKTKVWQPRNFFRRTYLDRVNKRMKVVLAKAKFDIADAHLYGPEERDFPRMDLVSRLSGGRPVLSAECGGPSLDFNKSYRPIDHFYAVIARNLNVLSAGGKFCLWFRLAEGPGGSYGNSKVALVDLQLQPKPGVWAFKLLSMILRPDTKIEKVHSDKNLFSLKSEGQAPLYLGWGEDVTLAELTSLTEADDAQLACVTDAVKGSVSISSNASEKSVQCPEGALRLVSTSLPGGLSP